jgi:hypothetical protein
MTMIVGSTSLYRFVAVELVFVAGAVALGCALKLWSIEYWMSACG